MLIKRYFGETVQNYFKSYFNFLPDFHTDFGTDLRSAASTSKNCIVLVFCSVTILFARVETTNAFCSSLLDDLLDVV